MSDYSNSIDEIKRKLRKLKKLENKIRSENSINSNEEQKIIKDLVWDKFFNISGSLSSKGRYTLEDIYLKSKEEFRNIINEYFFNVYYEYYKENGIVNNNIYNPEILKWMGLSPDSGLDDIKKRFRELAKKYHPDTGGESDKFIKLIENYKKLVE